MSLFFRRLHQSISDAIKRTAVQRSPDARYAQGQHNSGDFPVSSTFATQPSGSTSIVDRPDFSQRDTSRTVIPLLETLVEPLSAHRTTAPAASVIASEEVATTPSTSSSSKGTDEEQRRASSSGPANQDPDIPNIETHDFAYDSSSQQENDDAKAEKSSLFRDRRDGDATQSDPNLTLENMRQLNLQANSRGAAAMREDINEGGNVRRGKVGFREPGPSQSQRSRESRGSRTSSDDRAMRKAGENWVKEKRRKNSGALPAKRTIPPPQRPRSRGSLVSYSRKSRFSEKDAADKSENGRGPGSILLESATGSTTNSADSYDFDYDMSAEQDRVRLFYEREGYLPAPRQPPDAARRRLRIIRRLGLENPEKPQPGLQRFMRLACTMLGAKSAMVTIAGSDKAYVVAGQNFPIMDIPLNSALCTHTIVAAGRSCFVIRDPANDWRFKDNPFILTAPYAIDGETDVTQEEAKRRLKSGTGKSLKFYGGAPLVVGTGVRETTFGSLCVLDDKPNAFGPEQKAALVELASCVVSEVSRCSY